MTGQRWAVESGNRTQQARNRMQNLLVDIGTMDGRFVENFHEMGRIPL